MTERLQADDEGIARAVQILRDGGIVAVPTETVYGLAARADRADAVAKIYAAKGRPDFNPLIVHVAGLAQGRELALFDRRAEMLADAYWPGPLTLVLPREPEVDLARAITAGLPTIALRCPVHPVMRELLDGTGLPLAAPSANRSGSVSPTTASHVLASLDGRIDAVIDGGPCKAGLESTIVALRDSGWSLLRPGPVSQGDIAFVIGGAMTPGEGIEAPGQLESHYSPGKPVRLDARDFEADEYVIGFRDSLGDCSLSKTGDLVEAAARLYDCLHRAASSAKPRIAIAPVPNEGIGEAINDRLRRAATPPD